MSPAGPRQARAVVDSSHRPAMGRQAKWPRKPFQINSVSITGVFIKINYLGGCLPKTALLAGGRSEGQLEGTAQLSFESLGRFSHIQMCVSSPQWQTLQACDMFCQNFICRNGFSLILGRCGRQRRGMSLNSLLRSLKMKWQCFSTPTPSFTQGEESKMCLRAREKGKCIFTIHPSNSASLCFLDHWLIKWLTLSLYSFP